MGAPMRAGKAWLGAAAWAVALASGCGAEVVVDDPSLLPDDDGSGSGISSSELREGCQACATGSCGWCAYEGEEVYRCHGDGPPAEGYGCMQTGSVYSDESGLYICWRCEG